MFLSIGLLTPDSASSQSNLQGLRMASLTGRCVRVIAAGRELPAKCSPDPVNAVLINTSYPDGRSGFYIVSDGMVLAFSGMGSQQIKTSPDSVVQPVDLVLFNRVANGDSSKPTQLLAAGTCSFENPTKGVPTKLECSAQTEQGMFSLEFLHNGKKPIILGN